MEYNNNNQKASRGFKKVYIEINNSIKQTNKDIIKWINNHNERDKIMSLKDIDDFLDKKTNEINKQLLELKNPSNLKEARNEEIKYNKILAIIKDYFIFIKTLFSEILKNNFTNAFRVANDAISNSKLERTNNTQIIDLTINNIQEMKNNIDNFLESTKNTDIGNQNHEILMNISGALNRLNQSLKIDKKVLEGKSLETGQVHNGNEHDIQRISSEEDDIQRISSKEDEESPPNNFDDEQVISQDTTSMVLNLREALANRKKSGYRIHKKGYESDEEGYESDEEGSEFSEDSFSTDPESIHEEGYEFYQDWLYTDSESIHEEGEQHIHTTQSNNNPESESRPKKLTLKDMINQKRSKMGYDINREDSDREDREEGEQHIHTTQSNNNPESESRPKKLTLKDMINQKRSKMGYDINREDSDREDREEGEQHIHTTQSNNNPESESRPERLEQDHIISKHLKQRRYKLGYNDEEDREEDYEYNEESWDSEPESIHEEGEQPKPHIIQKPPIRPKPLSLLGEPTTDPKHNIDGNSGRNGHKK